MRLYTRVMPVLTDADLAQLLSLGDAEALVNRLLPDLPPKHHRAFVIGFSWVSGSWIDGGRLG